MEHSSTVSSLAGLLLACRANPDDVVARLVLADWLEERGDPRGELVRVQMELERAPLPGERQAELIRRAAILRRLCGPWLRSLADLCDDATVRRGFLAVTLAPEPSDPAAPFPEDPNWEWVDEVTVPESNPMVSVLAEARFRGITRFRFLSPSDRFQHDPIAALARCPESDRLTSLEVQSSNCRSAGLVALLSSPHLARLRHLVLDFTQIKADGLDRLTTIEHPSLESFRLFGADLGPAGGQALARSPS